MQLQLKQVSGLVTALKRPFTVSTTAPENPVEHQVWLEPNTLMLYVYFVGPSSSTWVEL